MADIMAAAQDTALGVGNRMRWRLDGKRELMPMEDIITQYYFRLNAVDQPGVLADVAAIFKDTSISIASVLQKEVDEDALTAEVVIMTHPARESAVRRAVEALQLVEAINAVNIIRVGI